MHISTVKISQTVIYRANIATVNISQTGTDGKHCYKQQIESSMWAFDYRIEISLAYSKGQLDSWNGVLNDYALLTNGMI